MKKKLTLHEVENILSNRTEYRVIYEKNGKEIVQVRDTVERAYALYCRENIEQKGKGRLVEVLPNGETIILRGHGVSPIIERKEDRKPMVLSEKKQPKTRLQCLLGDMSYDEYANAVRNFAAMHGTTPEAWGIILK